ncbi:4-hydroxy-3-methylbut-2-enyl diphosphate reductase [Streptomyces sp. S.PB5]|uniref:4-hydroxy-3-methylbut-2-enyl diphosphate reductase n=1 Tax=Streptomyces sp. S.PB5 TaxID=3020844 RepID=UPI0025AEE392|nr:4-hydroxy-3-methylbut-2-enyl diphosphate reductase [Streptomyces sp. S.PB5]MDN3029279.1 4-hydroxy-3-methylbut-2-enyl diphosphate reductase [Streptomyces sp. S.PB5]
MNRSVLSEVLHSTTPPPAPGTLVVATSWTHPLRGPIGCPAHHLLTAHAHQAGHEAHARSLPHLVLESDGPAPTTVFAVSYEHTDGGHRGLAIAVDDSDTATAAFAREQIASWSAVLRTRRALYVLHERPEQPESHPDTAQAPGTPVPRQQSGRFRGAWRACGCPSISACGSEESAGRSLRRFMDRGDEVIVVDTPDSPGSGTGPGAPLRTLHAQVRRIATPQQAEALTVTDPDRLAFVVAPGTAVTEATRILNVLRRRFPRLKGQHPREWCYTMDDLHTAVGSVLAQSDILLVAGQGDGPLVRAALLHATRTDIRVRDVPTLGRLHPRDTDAATIAVVDASADERIRRQLTQALDGLGPVHHVRRHVRSATLAVSAPAFGPSRPVPAEGDERRP